MHIFAAFIITACLLTGFLPVKQIPLREIDIDIAPYDMSGSTYISPQVISLSDLKFKNINKQHFDYSCGSAALATLLNYYLNENFTEYQVIQGLMNYGDKSKIQQRRAFSMLDMKAFVGKLGYKGVGYKAEFKDIEALDMPCIIPIERGQYRHFTVFKGIYGDRIILADPFEGSISCTKDYFKEIWFQKIIFVVYPDGAQTINGLQLTDADLRFIDEDSVLDIIEMNQPEIIIQNERDTFFTLPDEYEKYNPN